MTTSKKTAKNTENRKKQITVGVPAEIDAKLRALAKRTGKSLAIVTEQTIAKGLGLSDTTDLAEPAVSSGFTTEDRDMLRGLIASVEALPGQFIAAMPAVVHQPRPEPRGLVYEMEPTDPLPDGMDQRPTRARR